MHFISIWSWIKSIPRYSVNFLSKINDRSWIFRSKEPAPENSGENANNNGTTNVEVINPDGKKPGEGLSDEGIFLMNIIIWA